MLFFFNECFLNQDLRPVFLSSQKDLAALLLRRLIVNSVWLEIFVICFFLIGTFLANSGSEWFVGMPRFFAKIGKNKSGMPPEFCLFVIGGIEMLLYLIGHREQSQDLLLCL